MIASGAISAVPASAGTGSSSSSSWNPFVDGLGHAGGYERVGWSRSTTGFGTATLTLTPPSGKLINEAGYPVDKYVVQVAFRSADNVNDAMHVRAVGPDGSVLTDYTTFFNTPTSAYSAYCPPAAPCGDPNIYPDVYGQGFTVSCAADGECPAITLVLTATRAAQPLGGAAGLAFVEFGAGLLGTFGSIPWNDPRWQYLPGTDLPTTSGQVGDWTIQPDGQGYVGGTAIARWVAGQRVMPSTTVTLYAPPGPLTNAAGYPVNDLRVQIGMRTPDDVVEVIHVHAESPPGTVVTDYDTAFGPAGPSTAWCPPAAPCDPSLNLSPDVYAQGFGFSCGGNCGGKSVAVTITAKPDGEPSGGQVGLSFVEMGAGLFGTMDLVTYSSQRWSWSASSTASAAPIVQSVSPTHGPMEGGTLVTLTGSGFSGADDLTIGGVHTPFNLISDSGLSFTTPYVVKALQNPGAYDVVVSSSAGSSSTNPGDQFFFEGWYADPTPTDKSIFDVPLGGFKNFTVKAAEQDPVTIGYCQPSSDPNTCGTPPAFLTCAPGGTIPGALDTIQCTVQPTGPALAAIRFFDANDPGRISQRTYVVGHGNYVALGDSFSSGEGVPCPGSSTASACESAPAIFIPPSDADRCHRSYVAYPTAIGTAFYGAWDQSTFFAACSGATIHDVVWGRNHEPSGLADLDTGTDLVTLSVGGDDVGFSGVATDCVIRGFVLQLINGAGGPGSCVGLDDAHTEAAIDRIAQTGPAVDLSTATSPTTASDDPRFTLENLYYTIHLHAPNARLLLLGYPALLVKSPAAPCSSVLPVDWLNGIASDLDQAERSAAQASGLWAEYVPESYDSLAGHELCTPDTWVNNLDLDSVDQSYISKLDLSQLPHPWDPTFGPYLDSVFTHSFPVAKVYSFHPNAAGQDEFRQVVVDQYLTAPQGSQLKVFPFQHISQTTDVPPGSGSISFGTAWAGSDVILTVTAPSGRRITRGSAATDLVETRSTNHETFTIQHPEAGTWQISLYGASVAPDGETVRENVVVAPEFNFPPVARALASPATGTEPLTVAFDATGSQDMDGRIVSYAWRFGDGSTSTAAAPSYTYTKPGVYDVLLDVTDDGGSVGHDEVRVIVREPTRLVYTGPSEADFNDPTPVSANLTSAMTGLPIPGVAVTWSLGPAGSGGTCGGTTDGNGTASCSLNPVNPAGPTTIAATSAQSDRYAAGATSAQFRVNPEETVLRVSAPAAVVAGSTLTLSATLSEDGVTPLSGRTVTLAAGSGAGAQTCTAVTSTTGIATCSLVAPSALGPTAVTASFGGEAYHRPSAGAGSIVVFGYTAGGSFTVGDGTVGPIASAVGSPATFWSDQWTHHNQLSGGPAPTSFKGYENGVAAPTCGGSWTAGPGNSSAPPADAPSYTAVIVTSTINAAQGTVAGDVQHVVIVEVAPGYGQSPGHVGTGTIVAVLC